MPRTYLQNVEYKEIRDTLRTFLRDPSHNAGFTDFDYEGSNLSVIINLLAYTVHYHAIYSNFVVGEAFLRTARQRASVVSRVKDIAYIPRSYIAPTMIVNLTLSDIDGDPPNYTLTRGTRFKATVDGVEYRFVVPEDVTANRNGGEYFFEDLRLRQGRFSQFSYNVTEDNTRDFFEIPSAFVDTKVMQIRVKESPDQSMGRLYRQGESIVDTDGNSFVYWLQEGPNGNYEIEFGDGILSRQLEAGNVITMSYLITSGPDGNGINTISPDFTISGGYSYDISIVQPSFGGKEKESIQEVKFRAPKKFAAQNRIVTVDDYEQALRANVGDLRDVRVWGGEDNVPPQYGKVFIALETEDTVLTRGARLDIDRRILRPRRMPTVIPEFVTPSYINPNITVDAIYDATTTSIARGEIENRILNEIESFIDEEARTFGARVFISQLENRIFDLFQPDYDVDDEENSSETPIQSVTADMTLTAFREVGLNTEIFETFAFGIPLLSGSIESNRFTVIERFEEREVVIEDDGEGRLVLRDVTTNTQTNNIVGSVNYNSGTVTIDDLRISSIFRGLNGFYITVTPNNPRDIQMQRERIMRLGDYNQDLIANVPSPIDINLSIIA